MNVYSKCGADVIIIIIKKRFYSIYSLTNKTHKVSFMIGIQAVRAQPDLFLTLFLIRQKVLSSEGWLRY